MPIHLFRLCLMTLYFSLTINSVAAKSWDWHAVVAQGLFHTDENNIYGASKGGVSTDFTELSLSARYNPGRNYRVMGQAMYRHSGSSYEEVRLDYLFIDSQFTNSESYVNGFRVGRIKLPLGIYNDTRDIAFTRPSAYLSQSVYQDITKRDLLLSGDGVNLYFNRFTDNSQLNISLMYSQPENRYYRNTSLLIPVTASLPNVDIKDSDGYQYRISYMHDNGFTIALSGLDKRDMQGIATLEISEFIPSSLGNFEGPVYTKFIPDMTTHVDILSLQYSTGYWEFTFEYALTDNTVDFPEVSQLFLDNLPDTIDPDDPNPFDDVDSESYYIQVLRHLNNNWDLFARYDIYYYDRDDPDGSEFVYNDSSIPYSRFAKDSGIGVRWTPHPDMFINMEYHYVDGTSWLSQADNIGITEMVRYWNMVNVIFAVRF